MKNMNFLNTLGTAALCLGLWGCETPEQQEARYLAEARQSLQAGEYAATVLALKNVQQLDARNPDAHMLMGELLIKQGQLDAAFREFSQVVRQDDTNLEARLKLAELLLYSQKITQAGTVINSVLTVEPDNADALVLLASTQTLLKRYDEAAATLNKARQDHADPTAVALVQAVIFADTERVDQAIAEIAAALQREPDNFKLMSVLTGFYIRKHQLPEADAMLQRMIAVNPNDAEYYNKAAHYLLASGQPGKAEATLREAVAKMPDNDTARLNLVDFLLTQYGSAQAVAVLTEMVQARPDHADLAIRLARLQMAVRDVKGAERTLRQVLALDADGPLGIDSRDMLAELYMSQRRNDEARQLIDEVLKIKPLDGDALIMRGEFYRDQGRLADAIADFRTVINEQPGNQQVLKMLAGVYVLAGDDGQAQAYLEKAVGLAPDDEVARQDLALLQFRAGSRQQAREEINQFLKRNPGSVRSYETLFRFDLADKQWEAALADARRVQQLLPREGLGWYMAGLAYRQSARPEMVIENFQTAIDKRPDAEEPLYELVKTWMDLKQPDNAVQKLQQVLKQQPELAAAQFLLGKVHLELRHYDDAGKAFTRVQQLRPDWFGGYLGRAKVDELQKNPQAAIAVLQAGFASTGNAPEILDELAQLYDAQGQYQNVIDIYRQAYQAQPASLTVANRLAAYLADHAVQPGQLQQAVEIAAVLQDVKNPEYMETLAWIAYRQGDYAKARDLMQKVIELQPEAVLSQYHLGMILFQLKESSMAAYYLRKALAGGQHFAGAEQAAETLKMIHGENL